MKKATATLTMAALLSGCAGGLPGLRPLTYQEPAETRVLVSYKECPNASQQGQQIAPIVAAALLGAASKLLDGFGTALTKGAEGGALPSSVAMTSREFAPTEMPQCLIIIRGQFAEGGTALAAVPNTASVRNDAGLFTSGPIEARGGIGNKATIEALPEVSQLHHYIELQLRSSGDGSALTFAPVYTWIARSIDGTVKGTRELSIAVKLERPGKPATGSAVLLGRRVLGAAQKYELTSGRYPYESPWFAGLSSPASAPATAGQQQQDGSQIVAAGGSSSSAAVAPGSARTQPFPVTITTTVVETRPTKEYLAFVASVFTAARPAIDAALKSEIDPTTRENEQKTSYDAHSAYATAEAKAHADRLAYCAIRTQAATTESARFTASALARSSQILANKAALAADLNEPFPAGKLVVVSGSAAENAAACT